MTLELFSHNGFQKAVAHVAIITAMECKVIADSLYKDN